MSDFVSDLSGAIVIDDDNWQAFAKPIDPDGCSESGYIPRDWELQPLGSIEGTSAFPSNLLFDEKQIREIAEERERTKTRLSDLLRASNVKWLNQSPSNMCWCYAVVQAIMAMRVKAGLPFVRLCPASVCGPVKNYQNIGGWGSQALAYIIKNGVASEEFWPQAVPEDRGGQKNINAVTSRKWFESSRDNAALHTVDEWFDLRPRSQLEKLSCLARGWPVPSGYNRIRHEMCSIDIVIGPNGQLGCRDLDSYADSSGRFNEKIMLGSSMLADDGVVPRVTDASEK